MIMINTDTDYYVIRSVFSHGETDSSIYVTCTPCSLYLDHMYCLGEHESYDEDFGSNEITFTTLQDHIEEHDHSKMHREALQDPRNAGKPSTIAYQAGDLTVTIDPPLES